MPSVAVAGVVGYRVGIRKEEVDANIGVAAAGVI
jgi:hypothetical protein